jgi:hypothetical protein
VLPLTKGSIELFSKHILLNGLLFLQLGDGSTQAGNIFIQLIERAMNILHLVTDLGDGLFLLSELI